MARLFFSIPFGLLVLVASTKTDAQVTFQTGAPNVNGGQLFDFGMSPSPGDESRKVRWDPGDTNSGVGQNFRVTTDFTLDKYAFQLRGIADNLALPSGDADIRLTLWELPDLETGIIADTFEYPAASASIGSVPIATWDMTIESANEDALAWDWLIFDTPNIALSADVQYGMQIGWPTESAEVGQKIWIWVSNPFPSDFPIEDWAVYTDDDPGLDASYHKTWRSTNFALIAGPDSAPGDFDGDGDVDGHDFLLWQRNPTIGSLTDWQDHYGLGTPQVNAVPEPGTISLIALIIGLFGGWRKTSLVARSPN